MTRITESTIERLQYPLLPKLMRGEVGIELAQVEAGI